jgi:hypothetical protein
VLAWLEDHRAIGNIEEGFWRVDPTAPAPSREELQTLTRAAFSLDTEKLERLIEQEEAGWRREDILVIAREAVENIAAAKEEARRQAEEEAAAEVKGKPKA